MTLPTKLGTDYILDALAEEGLGHLFMVPGGLVDPFLPALARQGKLTPVVAAHEGGAVYMADGYARASGGFGAALGIGGPGCCNMATAVAAAKTDGSPVLVLTGEVPVDMEGRGAFQDASQATLDDTAVMGPLTRLSKTVADSREPESLVPPCAHHHVGAAARSGASLADARRAHRRMRDGLRKVAGFFADAQPLSLPQAEAALRLLADPNGRNVRIAMLAGAGVEHDAAAARLKELAERWSIPVATTLRAKGVFPEDHELSLGVFGYAGTRHATSAILGGELDCLLVLGSGFNERDTMHWTVRERTKAFMIHVNTDMDELTANGDIAGDRPRGAGELPRLPRPDARARRPARAGAASGPGAPARMAGEDQGRAAALRRRELQPSEQRRSIRPPRSRRCARRCRATASCWSIPARTAPSPGTTGAPTRRAATSRPPISGRWAGRSRRRSACNARGPTGGSR